MSKEGIVDDPKKPYKAYAAAVGSALGYGLADGLFDFNPWVSGVATLVCAGLGAYVTGNPKKWVTGKSYKVNRK